VVAAAGVAVARTAGGTSAHASASSAAAVSSSAASAARERARAGDLGAVSAVSVAVSATDVGAAPGQASSSVATPTGTSVATGPRTAATTARPVNHPPVLSVANQAVDEGTAVSVSIGASDPDGDNVSVAVSGLPAGLSASGAHIGGTVSYAASAATATRYAIASQNFTISVTATDSHGLSTTGSFTWTIRDTETLMPNCVGYYGCNGDGSCHEPVPNVDALSAHDGRCVQQTGAGGQIVNQDVAAGTIINRSTVVTYTYAQSAACS
jgi:hypothetical protein